MMTATVWIPILAAMSGALIGSVTTLRVSGRDRDLNTVATLIKAATDAKDDPELAESRKILVQAAERQVEAMRAARSASFVMRDLLNAAFIVMVGVLFVIGWPDPSAVGWIIGGACVVCGVAAAVHDVRRARTISPWWRS